MITSPTSETNSKSSRLLSRFQGSKLLKLGCADNDTIEDIWDHSELGRCPGLDYTVNRS